MFRVPTWIHFFLEKCPQLCWAAVRVSRSSPPSGGHLAQAGTVFLVLEMGTQDTDPEAVTKESPKGMLTQRVKSATWAGSWCGVVSRQIRKQRSWSTEGGEGARRGAKRPRSLRNTRVHVWKQSDHVPALERQSICLACTRPVFFFFLSFFLSCGMWNL